MPHKRLVVVVPTGDALLREPWKDIPADLLGLVLRLIPCAADRARVRSVCRSWRDAAAIQRLPPPLPMLVFSRFSFASFSPTMVITGFIRIPLHEDVTISWVGSFDEWIVGTRPSWECEKADGHCFLVNAFSRETIHLPQPCAFHFFDYSCKTLPIVNTSRSIDINIYARDAREYPMRFTKVVLSAPPASGSMCIVAAICHQTLALWHPGMISWCVCRCSGIDFLADIAFYQGRIYMVSTYPPSTKTLSILFFELEEVDGRVTVSYVEQCVTEPLPLVESCQVEHCNIVEWRGKLVVIIRYADSGTYYWASTKIIRKIRIYALDFSTNPCSFTEMNSLDGDCLFISSCSSKSFSACQYDGAKGDFVYFVSNYSQRITSAHPFFDVLAYNVRDATMTEFRVVAPKDNFGPFADNLLWLFPPK